MSDWFTIQNSLPITPEEVIRQALKEFSPVRVFACFSSGNDSQVSTHWAMTSRYAHEVFNINTGIGLAEAREHLYRVCDRFNWPLRVKIPPAMSYEQMVLEYGFPGPGCHVYPYVWLKERAICELVQETKRKMDDKVMLITGVRQMESARRMGYSEPIYKDGARIWVAPFYAYSSHERDAYMEKHGLVRNPVTEKIGISGECMCGAFARARERDRLFRFYPDMDSYLCWLEGEAKARKQPYCEWGNGRRDDPDQNDLDFMPMCVNCMGKPEVSRETP